MPKPRPAAAAAQGPAPPEGSSPPGGNASSTRPAAPHLQRGRSAEDLVARYLQGQGLTVVARNFRCRAGELDLVCLDAGILAVVEVRQRTAPRFGGALASVRSGKQRRLLRAAGCFLGRSARWRGIVLRFDVVAVNGPPDAAHDIVWIKDAFRGA